jgi:hypothetical protein
MATIDQLVAEGVLHKVEHEGLLSRSEFPNRSIFTTSKCLHWLEVTLHDQKAANDAVLSPSEQIEVRFKQFIRGDCLPQTKLNYIRHASGIVWEIKTADTRLFGAFHKLDCFIAHMGYPVELVKGPPQLYNGIAGETERELVKLELNNPKFIVGSEIRNVVSS